MMGKPQLLFQHLKVNKNRLQKNYYLAIGIRSSLEVQNYKILMYVSRKCSKKGMYVCMYVNMYVCRYKASLPKMIFSK